MNRNDEDLNHDYFDGDGRDKFDRMFNAFIEDHVYEMKQQAYEEHRIRRNLSCSDGMCGAEDCPRCRPGSYRFATEGEED